MEAIIIWTRTGLELEVELEKLMRFNSNFSYIVKYYICLYRTPVYWFLTEHQYVKSGVHNQRECTARDHVNLN